MGAVVCVEEWEKEFFTHLLPNVRETDKEELALVGSIRGLSWERMLSRSIATSNRVHAITVSGICHGVIGLRLYPEKTYACVWFVSSSIFKKYPKALCRIANSVLDSFSIEVPTLMNCASERSLANITPFLIYCGFTLYRTPIVVGGMPLYPFVYERKE